VDQDGAWGGVPTRFMTRDFYRRDAEAQRGKGRRRERRKQRGVLNFVSFVFFCAFCRQVRRARSDAPCRFRILQKCDNLVGGKL